MWMSIVGSRESLRGVFIQKPLQQVSLQIHLSRLEDWQEVCRIGLVESEQY